MTFFIPRKIANSGKLSVEQKGLQPNMRRGLLHSFPFLHGDIKNTSAPLQLTQSGIINKGRGKDGSHLELNQGSTGHLNSSNITLAGLPELSVLAVFTNTDWGNVSNSQAWANIAGERVAGGSGSFHLGKVEKEATLRFGVRTTAGAAGINIAKTVYNRQIYTVLGTWDGEHIRMSVDGELQPEFSTLSGGVTQTTTDRLRIGRGRSGEDWEGDLHGIWFFNRAIVGREAQDASSDAYKYMYEPRHTIIAMPSAAGAGPTLTLALVPA